MIKIFETGDIHVGKKYDRYPNIQEKLVESRFKCLENMVREAEKEECGLFVITGDTFEKVSNIKVEYIKRTVEILSSFGGTVLILPGNHDYYTEEANVWKDFERIMDKVDHNIILLKELKPVTIEEGNEKVTIYPCGCDSKYSEENNLGWIKDLPMDTNIYNIGIAHGAIQGVTPDMEQKYYQMSEAELSEIPVDVWLIGHTHVPYPKMEIGKEYRGNKIFNAGTPEQLHTDNNTLGYGFIITISKKAGRAEVTAKARHTGLIAYYNSHISVKPTEHALRNAIEKAISNFGSGTIIKLTINGVIKQEEYKKRFEIYEELLGKFMTYEIDDNSLSEEISRERIYKEFPEIGFAATVLERFLDNPIEIQMAYDLLKESRE